MKLVSVPNWPRTLPRRWSPRADLLNTRADRMAPTDRANLFAASEAMRLLRREPECTGLTNTYQEAFFVNSGDYTAVSNTAAEASLLTGINTQPIIPANWWLNQGSAFRTVGILARGVLSTTSTPTLIFQVRFGATAGSSYLGGTSVGVSAAITTAAGVTNKWWELQLEITCRVPGIGTGNATLIGSGRVTSPGGFASPFIYPLEPTTPDTATWTSTVDNAVSQYVNLSVTWSAASASNSIQCKQLFGYAFG